MALSPPEASLLLNHPAQCPARPEPGPGYTLLSRAKPRWSRSISPALPELKLHLGPSEKVSNLPITVTAGPVFPGPELELRAESQETVSW